MIPTNPVELFSPFLPTTYNIPDDDEEHKRFLNEVLCNFADVINDKTIGAYTQSSESFNGQKWSYDVTRKVRNGYQVIARIKSFISQAIPMPIGNINPQWILSHTWGSASLPCTAVGAGDGDYFSFMPMGDSRISYTASDTQLTITTDGSRASYQGYIIFEYIRDGT